MPDHLVALAAAPPPPPAAPSPGPLFTEVVAPAAAASGHVSTNAAASTSPPAGAGSAATAAAPRAATGYAATLERLRLAEAEAGEKYTKLILEEGKEAEAEVARRKWESLTKQLRAYEKDATEVLSASGQLWPASEVKAVLFELHAPLRDSIESLYDRLESRLETLPRAERRKTYRAEVGRLFAALLANKFTAPPAPEQFAA